MLRYGDEDEVCEAVLIIPHEYTFILIHIVRWCQCKGDDDIHDVLRSVKFMWFFIYYLF